MSSTFDMYSQVLYVHSSAIRHLHLDIYSVVWYVIFTVICTEVFTDQKLSIYYFYNIESHIYNVQYAVCMWLSIMYTKSFQFNKNKTRNSFSTEPCRPNLMHLIFTAILCCPQAPSVCHGRISTSPTFTNFFFCHITFFNTSPLTQNYKCHPRGSSLAPFSLYCP